MKPAFESPSHVSPRYGQLGDALRAAKQRIKHEDRELSVRTNITGLGESRTVLQPEQCVESQLGVETGSSLPYGGPGQLTPAQFAFLFKHPVDAEYAQKRLTVKTFSEWEAFFVRWDAARREEAERIRFETVQRGQKKRHGPPRRYLRERRSPRSISRDVRKGLARTRPK